MYSLYTALKIRIKYCSASTGSTVPRVIWKDRKAVTTAYTGLFIKEWSILRTFFWIGENRLIFYFLFDSFSRSTDRYPFSILKIWVIVRRITMIGATIVCVMQWASLTSWNRNRKVLVYRTGNTYSTIKEWDFIRTWNKINVLGVVLNIFFVLLKSHIIR